jgi:hypothetical protein
MTRQYSTPMQHAILHAAAAVAMEAPVQQLWQRPSPGGFVRWQLCWQHPVLTLQMRQWCWWGVTGCEQEQWVVLQLEMFQNMM